MSTATPPECKIDYQAAADHCHEADYATHARRLIECLSDEISWVRLKAEVGMMNEEVRQDENRCGIIHLTNHIPASLSHRGVCQLLSHR
jgi:hypothetical protein